VLVKLARIAAVGEMPSKQEIDRAEVARELVR